MTLAIEGRRSLSVAKAEAPCSAATRERVGEDDTTAVSWRNASGLDGRDDEKEVLIARGLPMTLRLVRRSIAPSVCCGVELDADPEERVRARALLSAKRSS